MKILIIEDDKYISNFLREELMRFSHAVDTSDDGNNGSYTARTNQYDAIILDYSLPSKNGIEVCKEIRASGKTTPIIFLSATGDTTTKIDALDAGADDYMTKPFSFRELTSRLRALSRRPIPILNDIINANCLTIDCNSQTITKSKKPIKLSKKEFALITFLARRKGKACSRTEIMDYVWDADLNPFSNTVETHIRLLRKKIGLYRGKEIIQNIPGRGYMIVE
jgi:DNA-binding response OmpR family regulator